MAEWVRPRPKMEDLPMYTMIDEFYCHVCRIPTPGKIGLQQHKEGAIHRAVRFGDIKIIGASANDKIYCNICRVAVANEKTIKTHLKGDPCHLEFLDHNRYRELPPTPPPGEESDEPPADKPTSLLAGGAQPPTTSAGASNVPGGKLVYTAQRPMPSHYIPQVQEQMPATAAFVNFDNAEQSAADETQPSDAAEAQPLKPVKKREKVKAIETGRPAVIQPLCMMHRQPLLGLAYMIEIWSPTTETVQMYLCNLCRAKCKCRDGQFDPTRGFFEHMCSSAHLKNYIRVHYPAIMAELESVHAQGNVYVYDQTLYERCCRIEQMDGRRMVVQKAAEEELLRVAEAARIAKQAKLEVKDEDAKLEVKTEDEADGAADDAPDQSAHVADADMETKPDVNNLPVREEATETAAEEADDVQTNGTSSTKETEETKEADGTTAWPVTAKHSDWVEPARPVEAVEEAPAPATDEAQFGGGFTGSDIGDTVEPPIGENDEVLLDMTTPEMFDMTKHAGVHANLPPEERQRRQVDAAVNQPPVKQRRRH